MERRAFIDTLGAAAARATIAPRARTRAARASCYLYSTEGEVDRFAEALAEVAAQ